MTRITLKWLNSIWSTLVSKWQSGPLKSHHYFRFGLIFFYLYTVCHIKRYIGKLISYSEFDWVKIALLFNWGNNTLNFRQKNKWFRFYKPHSMKILSTAQPWILLHRVTYFSWFSFFDKRCSIRRTWVTLQGLKTSKLCAAGSTELARLYKN
jgi:hypothetical protein